MLDFKIVRCVPETPVSVAETWSYVVISHLDKSPVANSILVVEVRLEEYGTENVDRSVGLPTYVP